MSAFDTSGAPGAIDSEALDWAIRMAEPDADWNAFVTWLEADPARAERYDRAAAAIAGAAESVARSGPPAYVAANDPEPAVASRAGWRGRWLGGAAAAALIGAVSLGLWHEQDQSYTIATNAGEQRTLTLSEGSRIQLAGGTRVRLDRSRPRRATLEAGEALFQVRHDADDPFQVGVGDLSLTDLGTVFDVRVLGARTQVAVSEGAVMVDADRQALRLAPGDGIVAQGGTLRRTRLDVADVGAWRDGRLAYDGATISEVAEDLSRQLGWRVTASPTVAGRIFNGTLETRAFRNDPALLGALLGVRVRHSANVWTLEAPQ